VKIDIFKAAGGLKAKIPVTIRLDRSYSVPVTRKETPAAIPSEKNDTNIRWSRNHGPGSPVGPA
jgi:hypothetical protein